MIKGVFLAISLAVFFSSLGLIVTGAGGLIHDNLLSGAVIGVGRVVSYAVISLIVSFIASALILINLLREF